MLGYVNQNAWLRTLELGEAVFWSRSRNALWHKGATSGHRLIIKEVRADCDADTLLAFVEPVGPACHRLSETCFDEEQQAGIFSHTDGDGLLSHVCFKRSKRELEAPTQKAIRLSFWMPA